jgi:uncharacterized protein YbjT (DUF2867 family)
MVGDGVLHECIRDSRVHDIVAITRSALGVSNPKVKEIRRKDFFDYRDLTSELTDIDACFFCLGVSAAGMKELDYHRLTYDLTLSAANALAEARPRATFCYVSGEGTDSSERSRMMWARVKGKTENALLMLPLKAYMFRPGFIRPRPGARMRPGFTRAMYAVTAPLYPLLKRVAAKHVTTSENVARAMIAVAVSGYSKRILENADINAIGGGS